MKIQMFLVTFDFEHTTIILINARGVNLIFGLSRGALIEGALKRAGTSITVPTFRSGVYK